MAAAARERGERHCAKSFGAWPFCGNSKLSSVSAVATAFKRQATQSTQGNANSLRCVVPMSSTNRLMDGPAIEAAMKLKAEQIARPDLLKSRLFGMTILVARALPGTACIALAIQRKAEAIVNTQLHALVPGGPGPMTHRGQGSNSVADANIANELQWTMHRSSESPCEAANRKYAKRPTNEVSAMPLTRKPALVAPMPKKTSYSESAPASQAVRTKLRKSTPATEQQKTTLTPRSDGVWRRLPAIPCTLAIASMSSGKSNDIGKYCATSKTSHNPNRTGSKKVTSSLVMAVGTWPLMALRNVVNVDATAGPDVYATAHEVA
mmetsp:Transcript_95827/g.293055  ORF Transcript_95827/g.293055 Transcript_95827/m.293055 type:complete len:322 (-) Transcript_95827:494-1459(-)